MARSFDPLNPLLYSRLLARFGRVTVSKVGEAASVYPVQDVFGRQKHEFHGGEYYQVCCPYCHDTRFRLYISHLWGHYDRQYRTYHRDLVFCFNEQCLQQPGSNDRLYHEIYGLMDAQIIRAAPVRQGVSVIGRQIGAPGRVASLANLPIEHAANQYLLSRGYDPYALAQLYQLGYCEEPSIDYPIMWNRLVIPIYQNGQYVGFQGRALMDVKPKYYNPPGSMKTEWLYNIDNAKHYSVIVVTEGVTKVWRIGPFAVALLGKSISGKQPEMIGRLAEQADFIVLYLDGEAWTKPPQKTNFSFAEQLSPAEQAIRTLSLHVPERKLIVIRLEGEQAPDEFSTEVNQAMLLGQLRQRGWVGDERRLLQRRAASESFRLPARRV